MFYISFKFSFLKGCIALSEDKFYPGLTFIELDYQADLVWKCGHMETCSVLFRRNYIFFRSKGQHATLKKTHFVISKINLSVFKVKYLHKKDEPLL